MADQEFYTLITTTGKAKIANATAFGTKVNFTTLKVGDGNGNYYEPTESQTDLIHTVWSGAITSISTDPNNPNWIIIAVSIPATVGGFMIREVGIFDDNGTMIAIGKYPETYKPTSETGSTKDLTIRTILEVSNAGTIELKVDPNIIVATKADFNELAGTGRTTETVKKNADNIKNLSTQMADIPNQTYITEKAKQVDLITTNAKVATNTADINSLTTVKADKTYVDDKVATVASGAPDKTFVTLADLTAAYPTGDIKNKLVASDGHIYNWNGSAWTDTGIQYQSTGIGDRAVSFSNVSDYLRKILSNNLLSTNKSNWELGSVTNGSEVTNNYRVKSKLIPVDNTKTYLLEINNSDYSIMVPLYDSSGIFLRYYQTGRYIASNNVMHFGSDVTYIKLVIQRISYPTITIDQAINDLPLRLSVIDDAEYIPTNKEFASKFQSKDNIIPYGTNWIAGTLSNGIYTASEVRLTTDFIEVEPNSRYTINYMNDDYQLSVWEYDKDKNPITSVEYSQTTFDTDRRTKYVRFVIKNPLGDYEAIHIPDILIYTTKEKLYSVSSDIFHNAIWSQGSIDSNGDELTNTIRLKTDFIKTIPTTYRVVFSDANYKISIHYYDENKTHIGSTDYWSSATSSPTMFGGSQGAYVRFILNQNTSETDETLTTDIIPNVNIIIYEDQPSNYSKSKNIRIVTNNIGHFGVGIDYGYKGSDIQAQIINWFKHFGKMNADIVGIQEFCIYMDYAKTIRSDITLFKKLYPHLYNGFFDDAILSKFPLYNVSCGIIGSSDPSTQREYIKAYFDIDNITVCVATTHPYPNTGNESIRQTQYNDLITMLSDEKYFILTGDFNALTADEFAPFINAGYNLSNCGQFGNIPTYMYDNTQFLDNIITSTNILINNVEVASSAVTSDHYALSADLTILY
ncbi:hypothetical protein D9O40_05360 [Clostridium autoethanogenum]|uniref:Endonuclease/exonuclease/phosphatase domain-containing protein n=1 Tax=Clostridium autoethanogenum TaxID=84023 RepID=A0A3M0SWC3_9CLOT|nr:phage tail protein [Clostridium autoethanogenum]RMD02729.1 hypothetical protein D9O40_05360 [Clostridium autoethanogenum]